MFKLCIRLLLLKLLSIVIVRKAHYKWSLHFYIFRLTSKSRVSGSFGWNFALARFAARFRRWDCGLRTSSGPVSSERMRSAMLLVGLNTFCLAVDLTCTIEKDNQHYFKWLFEYKMSYFIIGPVLPKLKDSFFPILTLEYMRCRNSRSGTAGWTCSLRWTKWPSLWSIVTGHRTALLLEVHLHVVDDRFWVWNILVVHNHKLLNSCFSNLHFFTYH